jgi:hypothetical protein
MMELLKLDKVLKKSRRDDCFQPSTLVLGKKLHKFASPGGTTDFQPLGAFQATKLLCLLLLITFATALHCHAEPETPEVVSSSGHYSMQSTVTIAEVGDNLHQSSTYEVLPQIDKANSGLAQGSVTKMSLSWPVSEDEKSIGFDIFSSYTGAPGSFARLNPEPIDEPPYDIHYNANGTYYYIVYRIDLNGTPFQWTEVFSGTFTGVNAVTCWGLYE